MTALPVQSLESYAVDINDSGIIVGTMRAAGGLSKHHAYIYSNGAVTNLNTLIPAGTGLHLAYANGVNNTGQIVGVAVDSGYRYRAYLLTPVATSTPVINVRDASVTEGHSGVQAASFTVTLSAAQASPVSVSYSTASGGATPEADYRSASGTMTFEVGQTVQTLQVLVNGDRAGEPNETFFVNLSQASEGAVIADSQGVGTIIDDEPRISISDVSRNEGQSGVNQFVFSVTISPPTDVGVTLSFATANGSAISPEDYTSNAGSLSFATGETSKTISVAANGDRKREGQEVFYVNLFGASGALIADPQGTGVIRNDDR